MKGDGGLFPSRISLPGAAVALFPLPVFGMDDLVCRHQVQQGIADQTEDSFSFNINHTMQVQSRIKNTNGVKIAKRCAYSIEQC